MTKLIDIIYRRIQFFIINKKEMIKCLFNTGDSKPASRTYYEDPNRDFE